MTSTLALQDPRASLRRQLRSARGWLPPGWFLAAVYWDIESGGIDLEARSQGEDWQGVRRAGPAPRRRHADLLAEAASPAPRFAAVVCEDIERSGRDMFNALKLEKELSRQGIPLFATDEPADIEGVNATTVLVRRVKQGVAEWYRLQLKEKIWKGLVEHSLDGWNIGTPAYGYAADRIPHPVPFKAAQGRTKSRLMLDPVRAPVIAQMYAWRTVDAAAAHGISRDGDDPNPHPATRRAYPYRSRIRCRDCRRRMTGTTYNLPAGTLTYYRCPHNPATPKHAADHPDHPRTVQAPETRLDRIIGGFFATRIFGPGRAALLADQLPATDADAAAARDAEAARLQARIRRIETAQNSQILELEDLPADPADTAAAAMRARIRARFADLHHEREHLETQLANLAKTTPAATDPGLLDELPLLGDILPGLPPALKARLLAAFGIEILWNKPGQQVTVFAEITEATLQAIPGITDPGQDGYHDTSPQASNDDPVSMGHLNNTPRAGRDSHLSTWARVRRDQDVITGADAGDMRIPVLRGLAAAAVAAGLVSGCTGAPSSQPTSPTSPAQTARSAQRLAGLKDVRPCPGIAGFRCGSLSVRLDPFGSVPGRLSLRVAVSGVASAPRGVLLFLTGGPGEPGVPFVPRLVERLGPALDGYRLVMLDQRGTGAGALDCPALQRQMGASDLTVPSPAAVRSCAAAIGPDRRFYATADTVTDIEALRAALGVARLTVDGVSYGSYVAERFALAHPGEVSRLVLDSVVPSWNVDPLQLANMRQSAAVLRDVCAAQRCGFDPASDLAAVVRRYHDGPALLDMLVALSVGDPSFPGVPTALHAAAAGHPDALTALVARVRAADAASAGELSQGLHASALCADMPMPWGGPDTPLAGRPAALARAVGRLTPAQVWPFDRATAAGNGFIQTCLHWPPSSTPPPASPSPETVRAELPRIPVLLLAGGHDLSTPLAGARAQAALAPDGHLFLVPTAGHSVQNRAAGDPAAAELARFLG